MTSNLGEIEAAIVLTAVKSHKRTNENNLPLLGSDARKNVKHLIIDPSHAIIKKESIHQMTNISGLQSINIFMMAEDPRLNSFQEGEAESTVLQRLTCCSFFRQH